MTVSRVPWSARTRRWLSVLAVCAAAVAPYLSTLEGYFLNDDFGVVQLLSRKPLTHFPRWFVTSWMEDIWGYVPDEVRPFPALSYQLASLWGATWTVPNHALNIAFHAGNTLLVLALARSAARLGPAGATFAAAAFALLPVHPESVAWITGRVDTFPTFFYLASFLCYARWRTGQTAGAGPYAGSLALFFVALFSKQNTITMVASLVLYDLTIGQRPRRPLWRWSLPYLPFVALTAGYLALRLALFGEVAREGRLTASEIRFFLGIVERHVNHVVLGAPGAGVGWPLSAGVAAAIACTWGWRRLRGLDMHPAAALLYFGPLWWIIGVAPVLVAGYESPRHVYLASVGWAVVLGITLDSAMGARRAAVRRVAGVAAIVVLAAYGFRLVEVVGRWNTAARVSARMVEDLEREALAVPPGTLVIAGAPIRSWEWSLPFAAQPPFTCVDVFDRVVLISPMRLQGCRHCWEGQTRDAVRAWRARGAGVLALRWNADTGELSKLGDREFPALRGIAATLPDTDTTYALERTIDGILTRVVPDRPLRDARAGRGTGAELPSRTRYNGRASPR